MCRCWRLQACWTWAYAVEVAGLLLAFALHVGIRKACHLRRALHEERYLVGRQINNMVEAP
jgi:hypothetical protein